jgi:hypothetical protein
MKLGFSLHIFEKSSHIKFHEHPSNGSHLLHADRQHDKANSRFRNPVQAPTSESEGHSVGRYRPDTSGSERELLTAVLHTSDGSGFMKGGKLCH